MYSLTGNVNYLNSKIAFVSCVLFLISAVGHAQSGPFLPNFNFTQEGEQIGSAPSMAVFNNRLYVAFKSDNSSHTLFIDSTADGVTFAGAREFPDIKVGSTPTLAVLNGKLYVGFVAENGSHQLFVCSTSDVVTFSCPVTPFYITGAPALSVLNGTLYLAAETQVDNYLMFSSTTDGTTWAPERITSETVGTPPAMTAVNGTLLLSFQANDPSHKLFLQQSATNGTTWGSAYEYATAIGGTPALATEGAPNPNNQSQSVMLAFQANDSGHHLWYDSIDPTPFYIRQDNALIGSSPSEAIFTPLTGPFAGQETLFVSFQANDSNRHLWFGGQTVASFSATN